MCIFVGSALVFIVYPEVLAKLPGAQFWCFVFFLMLITLGLDSQVKYLHVTSSFDDGRQAGNRTYT